MSRQANKSISAPPVRRAMVCVALAEEDSFARHFQKILQRDNIPVTVRSEEAPKGAYRIGLWVPRTLKDRALRLLQSENALDGYYEAMLESAPAEE